MIKLMGKTFFNEGRTKAELADFIVGSERLSMGEQCSRFEEEFSRYQGRSYSALFNSGSSANLALIQALQNTGRLEKGDNVGFSSLTWATNVMPLLQQGLNPVPLDVELSTLNSSSRNLQQVIEKTPLKALFVTNLLGFCSDLDRIERVCKDRGIMLLEDNCEALGSALRGRKLGNYGLASTFSFFVGHHLSTIEGGMVSTDDPALYSALVMARAHGWSRHLPTAEKERLRDKHKIDPFFDQYTFYTSGYNLRPTEITGFLGRSQLKYLDGMNEQREKNFARLSNAARKNPRIFPLDVSHMSKVSNFAFPVVFRESKDFEAYKARFEGEAEIRPIVGGAMTKQPFFAEYLSRNSLSYSCPNAELAHRNGFYMPNNAELTEEEVSTMARLLS